MSPTDPTPLADRESEIAPGVRGRPRAASRAALLTAAGEVFDRTEPDGARGVTMDTVAMAAGVGKATLFREFGDRDGLLDALSSARFSGLRTAATEGAPPFDPATPATVKVTAFLDAVLDFKLDNANILRARERAGSGDLRSDRYCWTHSFLQQLLDTAAPHAGDGYASLTAHVLLGAVRVDLLDVLLMQGHTVDDLRRSLHEHAHDYLARHHGRP